MRRLAKAGDRGDQNAIEAVWQAWLAHPDDARWDLLAQWRDPGELARAVFAAAVDPDRAPGEREAIGQFCARHGLMPDDDIQQVLFYVLTGQLARYRAADARGRLLGAVYQRVGHRTRTALQQALAEAGDVELFLVLTDACPGARATILAEPESHDLICQLADRSDWDRLWQLVRELPLGDAVTAVRYFQDGWRPSADGERVLFDRLVHTGPHQLARARDALTVAALTQVTFRDPLPVWGGAISADGSLLALVRGGPASAAVRMRPRRCCCCCMPTVAGSRWPTCGPRRAIPGSPGSRRAFTPAGGFALLCEHQVAFCDSDGMPTGHRIALRPSPVSDMTPALLATAGGRVVAGQARF